MNFIWEALVILIAGFVLLRISGKKTVSEMTGLEIITLLSVASMVGHAIAGNGLWKTIISLCIFIVILILAQFLSLKFDFAEKIILGKATTVIQDGQILQHNLKKLRLTVDQLEAKLREKGISSIEDVQTATLEMTGLLGYELKRHAKPVTIGELEKLMAQYRLIPNPPQEPPKQNLFEEVIYKEHQPEIPRELD